MPRTFRAAPIDLKRWREIQKNKYRYYLKKFHDDNAELIGKIGVKL